jgi:hypothetical protein
MYFGRRGRQPLNQEMLLCITPDTGLIIDILPSADRINQLHMHWLPLQQSSPALHRIQMWWADLKARLVCPLQW